MDRKEARSARPRCLYNQSYQVHGGHNVPVLGDDGLERQRRLLHFHFTSAENNAQQHLAKKHVHITRITKVTAAAAQQVLQAKELCPCACLRVYVRLPQTISLSSAKFDPEIDLVEISVGE